MMFNDIEEIKKTGFEGFKKMEDLFIDSSMLPDSSGVYLVLNANSKPGEFLTVGTGGWIFR